MNEGQYNFSIGKLVNISMKEKKPYAVTIELLTACNMECIHCYIPQHDSMGKMSTEKVKEVLLELKNLGTLEITFTGGEIFLREDLWELISFSRKLGFNVSLFTNGTLINEEIANKLAEVYIQYVSLTIFSLKEDINDMITQRKGSLRKILTAIDLLEKYKIKIQIKTPVMEYNKYEYKEIKKFCDERGYTYVINATLFSKTDKDKSPLNYFINSDDLVNVIADIDEHSKSNGIERDNKAFNGEDIICPSLSCSLFIDAEGKVYPCISFRYCIGDIYKDSIESILKNSILKKLQDKKKNTLTECKNCKYYTYCDRCPGNAYFEDESIDGCSHTAKKIAIARYIASEGGNNDENIR